MKLVNCVIVLLVLASCGTVKMKETAVDKIPPPQHPTENETVAEKETGMASQNMGAGTEVNFANSKAIGDIMGFLASDALQGRDSGSEGLEKAAAYIEGVFKKNHVKPYFKAYQDTLSNFDKTTYNMVGFVEGNDPKLKNEFVVIGAHYDHIGIINPVGEDVIANGANDNASGTTTVLELARYFGNAKTNKRSIIFALFSAEEKGLLGSQHLAEKLKGKNLNLYTMLNFEMVGVPLQNKDYFMYVTGYEKSNLAAICNTYANEKLVGFLPSAKRMSLFQRSDNYSFHDVFKVPSQTFCTFDFTNFGQYHQVGDENGLMDFNHMATLVNKSIPVLEGIVNATTKEIKYQ